MGGWISDRVDLNNQGDMYRFLSMFTLHFDGLQGNLFELSKSKHWVVNVEYDLCHRAYRVVIAHKVGQFVLCQLVGDEIIMQRSYVPDMTGQFPIHGSYPAPQERNMSVMELLEMANQKLDEQMESENVRTNS